MSRREGVQKAKEREGRRGKGTSLADCHRKTPACQNPRNRFGLCHHADLRWTQLTAWHTDRRLSLAQLASSPIQLIHKVATLAPKFCSRA